MSTGERPRDAGISLLEVLFAVVLLGLASAGILPAVWGNVRGSGLQDQLGNARRLAVSAGEYVTSPTVPRVSCASAAEPAIKTAYQNALNIAPGLTLPAGWTLTVTDLAFWNGGVAAPEFSDTCHESATVALPLQRISLEVKSVSGRVTEKHDVVKGG